MYKFISTLILMVACKGTNKSGKNEKNHED